MPWPNIFFKARKPQPQSELPPSLPPAPEKPENPKPPPPNLQPPAIKPVPAAATAPATPKPATQFVPQPTPKIVLQGTPTTAPIKSESIRVAVGTGTRTLPAMHGVVLRPPTRTGTGSGTIPAATPSGQPRPPAAPMKNVEQLMAEADPVRTLSQSGSVRMLKRLTPEPEADKGPGGTEPAAKATPPKLELVPPKAISPSPGTPAPIFPPPPPPFPAFKPAARGKNRCGSSRAG